MNPLEIVLILIGIIIIAISCKLVEHKEKEGKRTANIPLSLENRLTEDDKKKLMEKMDELLTEVSEETIIRTDDALSKLSNEKIMAVNEFSDQILEKIKRNHEEVVFLYSMLNDKEKELKAAVREIDSSKKKVQDIIEGKADNNKIQAAKNANSQTPAKPVVKTVIQPVQNEKTVKASTRSEVNNSELQALNSLSSNNNTQILALYSQGRSVVEISKLLGMGQGEVKLVIDLFKGKK